MDYDCSHNSMEKRNFCIWIICILKKKHQYVLQSNFKSNSRVFRKRS